MKRASVAATMVALATACWAAEGSTEAQARAHVGVLVSSDLAGNAERYRYAKWLHVERGSEANDEQGVFEATWDPLVVVTECRVKIVTTERRRGTATIVCKRIGSSPGGQVFKDEEPTEESVRWDLRYERGAWWVIDPPVPRVSIDALIGAYEEYLRVTSPPAGRQAAPEAREPRKKTMEVLELLQRLRARTLGPSPERGR